MKQPIPLGGAILVILLIGTTTYLAFFTHLLVPKAMKEKSTSRNVEVLDYEQNNYSYRADIAPSNPLFVDEINLSEMEVSPPVIFRNLGICLIYGNTTLDKKRYFTLKEALNKKMVVVHETQDVNQLSLDNLSDQYIYINSGEIVKGGQQDRTIQYDVVIGPRVKNIDLASFCVEHGRWNQRGNENQLAFSSSEKMISSNDLKLAAKRDKNQSKVWAEVEEYQANTDTSVNACVNYSAPITVKDQVSESSLELTLENDEVEKLQQLYKQSILNQLKNTPQVTGFAYFINGKLYGIDVFNNHRLFNDLFDKLFEAAIAEAISEYDKEKKLAEPTSQNVKVLLGSKANVYEDEQVNEHTQFRSSQLNTRNDILIFTSIDKKENKWLHRNWLRNTGM